MAKGIPVTGAAFAPTSVAFGIVAPGSVLSANVGTVSPLQTATSAVAQISAPSLASGFWWSPFSVTSFSPLAQGGTGPVHIGPVHIGGSGVGAAGSVANGGVVLPGHGTTLPTTLPRMMDITHVGGVAGSGQHPVTGPVGPVSLGPPSVAGSAASGQYLIAEVGFDALDIMAGNFNANLVITSPDWNSESTIPLSAQIVNLTLKCKPNIGVVENSTAQLTVSVTCAGPATTATLMTTQESWPQGVTIAISPAALSLVPGVPQSATVSISAALDAPASETTLYIYGTGFGNLEFGCQTQLSVAKLVLKPSPIDAKYASLPNAKTVLGQPIAVEQFCMDYIGQFRAYQNGAIYWNGTSGVGAYAIYGPVLPYYLYGPDPPAPGGPTVPDYASPWGDYPSVDTMAIAAGSEIILQDDFGIYATQLGTFGVSNETCYRANGGSTGSLSLPIANPTGGQAGVTSMTGTAVYPFTYQDFENGAIFQAGVTSSSPSAPEAILFGAPGSAPTPFPFTTGGTTLSGSLHLQPNPPGLFPIPLGALIAIPASEVTQLVQNSVTNGINSFNTAHSDEVQFDGFTATNIGALTSYQGSTLNRTYMTGFSLYAGGCIGLVGGLAAVTFDVLFILQPYWSTPTANTLLQVALIDPSVQLSQDGLVNLSQSRQDQIRSGVLSALQQDALSFPLPPMYSTTQEILGSNVPLNITFSWMSAKVLVDGTLCLFAGLQTVIG
jgi:LGFP repeat